MHLIQVPATANTDGVVPLETLWPAASKHLEKAIELSGGVTSLDAEYQELASLRKQLWVIVTGEGADKHIAAAGITSLKKHSGGLQAAYIELLGGENMKAWFELKEQFEKWAKDEGCTKIRLHARRGWAKHLPDYKLAAYEMEKTLE